MRPRAAELPSAVETRPRAGSRTIWLLRHRVAQRKALGQQRRTQPGQVELHQLFVQQLGLRHAASGVKAEHYDSVQQALLWTLALILQEEYTAEVRSAWATAYAMLAGVMKEAAWGVP